MTAIDRTREAPDAEVSRLRVPPHSTEAEQSVLGALLCDNLAWDRVADLLQEADFYAHEHRLIFGAIGALIGRSQPADVITVHQHLDGIGKARDCGGLVHLNALAQSVPSAGNIRRYAEIVRERAVLRRLIAASDEIATAAFNPQGRTVPELLSDAEAKVLAVGRAGAAGSSFRTTASVMLSILDRVQELHDLGGGDVVGVATGFHDLDKQTAGLQPGDLVIVAARPSMGKTAFAMNIAEAVALKAGLPVAVFSMEMSAQQLLLRMAGSVGRINQTALRTGRIHGAEWERLTDANEKLSHADIVIDETPALTVAEVRSKGRRMAREVGGKLGLVVVDYLQLMAGTSGSEENRATQLGEISRGLKAMAKELDCPVIALSQLNRSVESRADKRPLMSDLRESGAIEQDADVIAFIYRDDYYNKHSKEPGVAEILISKQRTGPTGTVRLAWSGQFTRFDNLAADYEAPRAGHHSEEGFN